MATGSTLMTSYSESLRELTSHQLAKKTEQLGKREHALVAQLIAHLAEISRRKLHLDLGFRSLFEYCLKKLGLTEGSTALRIQVANVCRRYPLILTAIQEGQVSLTVAGKLAPHLTTENQHRLIEECCGMTKREVEEYLVRLAPKPAVTPGIARQPQGGQRSGPAPAKPSPDCGRADLFTSSEQTQAPTPHPSATDNRARTPRPGEVAPCQVDLFNIRFPANQEFKNKLERLAEVLHIDNPHANLAAVLEAALDVALDKKDPQKRQERREKRAAKRAAAATNEPAAGAPKTSPDEVSARSRAIPQPLRDQILIRAEQQCEYRAPDGTRCSARTHLDIDHVLPYARGGPSRSENLRVLCHQHNHRHAERCYGRAFMENKIAHAQERVRERPGVYYAKRRQRRRQFNDAPPAHKGWIETFDVRDPIAENKARGLRPRTTAIDRVKDLLEPTLARYAQP